MALEVLRLLKRHRPMGSNPHTVLARPSILNAAPTSASGEELRRVRHRDPDAGVRGLTHGVPSPSDEPGQALWVCGGMVLGRMWEDAGIAVRRR